MLHCSFELSSHFVCYLFFFFSFCVSVSGGKFNFQLAYALKNGTPNKKTNLYQTPLRDYYVGLESYVDEVCTSM
jgi:hypothetical protein